MCLWPVSKVYLEDPPPKKKKKKKKKKEEEEEPKPNYILASDQLHLQPFVSLHYSTKPAISLPNPATAVLSYTVNTSLPKHIGPFPGTAQPSKTQQSAELPAYHQRTEISSRASAPVFIYQELSQYYSCSKFITQLSHP